MDISHNFRFRWNDHVPHLSQVFSELRFEEVYCDTTLITEDGFIMKAHGAVLITTSRYFERVLADVTPDQHPIIVLKGINYEELSYLLDYIYQGVTQVDQPMMESVLDVADLLEIKGLSKMKNNLSLKKLLAPSVLSGAEARDSSCSSPSKSPSPLSPQSPNSPSSDVYVQSFSLKTDHEERSEDIAYESSRNRLNYVEKSVGNERSFDTSEYVASTSSKHSVLSTEYLDQTLGIDLSLSRGSCEENVKTSGKNPNIQEETPLRKRKIMHSDEGPSTSELNCSKYEEEKMSEGLILHQKKKVFSKSDSANGNELLEGYAMTDNRFLLRNDSRKYSSEYSDEDFYSECDSDRMEFFELEKLNMGSEDVLKQESKVLKSDILKCGFTIKGIDAPSTSGSNLSTTERKILLSRSNLEENFAGEDPLFIPESSEQFLKFGETFSIGSNSKKIVSVSEVDVSEINQLNDSCNLQLKRPFLKPSSNSINANPNNSVSNYVAVRVIESEKLGSSRAKVDGKTQEIFRELEQRIQRTPSKVKRPLSMYTLFMKEKYPEVAEQNPDKKGPAIIKILSSLWRNISQAEKQQWKEKANELLKEFMVQNPGYIYCPKKAQDEKFEYYRKKVERRNMFKINPYMRKF